MVVRQIEIELRHSPTRHPGFRRRLVAVRQIVVGRHHAPVPPIAGARPRAVSRIVVESHRAIEEETTVATQLSVGAGRIIGV
ncbi:MAG: hypothetical protein E4H28_03585, partial [Gemmatimonadales bacterium]